MAVAFDQYQRYRTLSNICIEIKKHMRIEKLRILEVGANTQENLGKILVEDEIFYTDLALPEELKDNPKFFEADATNLVGIEDNTYDVVLASDVFEHIPEEKREDFITEINRVAKYAAIVCFPHKSQENEEAEKRANEFFRALCGTDYIWLEEHIRNGLPKREVLEECLRRNQLHFCEFTHGSVQVWEKMMKNHFYCAQFEHLYPLREKIDEYYDTYVYPVDIEKANYRSFYIMFKNAENEEFYSRICQNIFYMESDNQAEYAKIWELSQELVQVAQMNLIQNIEKGSGEKGVIYCTQNELEVQCFFDRGNGFSEDDKSLYPPDKQNENSLSIPIAGDVKRVRIDPVEGVYCIIDRIEILCGYDETVVKNNGFKLGDKIIFATTDPQLIISIPEGCTNLKIRFGLLKCIDGVVESLLDNLEKLYLDNIKEYQKMQERLLTSQEQFNKLKNAYSNVKSEKEMFEQGYWEVKQNYEAIRDSEFWKATKPLRKATNVAKKIVRKCVGNGQQPEAEEVIEVEETIKFSVIIPLYNTPVKYLREVLDSVVNQSYSNWELCLGDASNENCEQIREICMSYVQKYPEKVKYQQIENKGIAANSNFCIEMASGEYIALCDHDDLYLTDALKMNAIAIQKTGARVLYSDEEHLDKNGKRVNPFYKPNWSPDLLRSQMYTCHLFVFSRSIFDEVGGFRSEFDGSQDYDLMLRFSEVTNQICHIPEILYLWRESETSTANNKESKPYAETAGFCALQDHLARKYKGIARAEHTENAFVYETRYDLMKNEPLVSIIIPMKDGIEFSDKCVESILEKSTYQNYEILILNNCSEKVETIKWFERVQKRDSRVRVVEAEFEFNWSKLNNFGTRYANGEVYIFLNNDTVVITEDWIERLCENALREDVGVVGPLLLYEDGTIQHAGVVVGIGGWADHIYKGQEPVHYGAPFVSRVVTRNVTAVTGACMAVSKERFLELGKFKEEFIICGSDVELCLNAFQSGYNNIYNANVRLYHLESKSRDSYIPEVDFQLCYQYYKKYREYGDPFYNFNLDMNSTSPMLAANKKKKSQIIQYVQINWRDAKDDTAEESRVQSVNQYTVGETLPITPRALEGYSKKRLNILVPSVDIKHVFGGIATALKFYDKLCEHLQVDRRIIVTDSSVDRYSMVDLPGYRIVNAADDAVEPRQIVGVADRYGKTLPVAENDIFMTTGWWTTYIIADIVKWQEKTYQQDMKKIIYFIQDYEPGFYPWSSRYLMADSTYRNEIPTIAIFNSKLLYDFFKANGYVFDQEYFFDPVLNDSLKAVLQNKKGTVPRRKQIMLYGRPSTQRNAFELIVESLQKWVTMQPDVAEWRIISAGEKFDDIDLGNGMRIEAVGKMSLEEYATTMLETKAAISLMVSPHPSYPPLEMATFGIKVITNAYGSKDLSSFSDNIVSLKNCSSANIARTLVQICQDETEGRVDMDSDYYNGKDGWDEIIKGIRIL